MAQFEGGIFSRGRGKVSGIVFSEASTRRGKKQTARELVKPHDPKTSRQLLARKAQSDTSEIVLEYNNRFSNSVPGIAQSFTDAVYRKAVGQLSGFQSLKSVLLSARDLSADSVVFSELPSPTIAGNLHTPNSVSFQPIASDQIQIDWSTELGSNGSPNDTVITAILSTSFAQGVQRYRINFDNNGEGRSTGSAMIPSGVFDPSVDGWLVLFVVLATSGTRVINRSTVIYNQQPNPFM